MEEMEPPMEHLHEEINEKTEKMLEMEDRKWVLYVAISTALMAVFAAIAGMMAGHDSNEALIQQVRASDQWAFYQAKSIKAEIRLLEPNAFADNKPMAKIKEEEEVIRKNAISAEKASAFHLERHLILAKAVTLLQVAIAIAAIAILTRRKFLWFASMAIALAGILFFVSAVLNL